MKNLFLGLMTLLTSVCVHAQLQLGTPGYGGTGCPAGTASIVASMDSSLLSVVLDEMVVDGSDTSASFTRKACNLRLPFSIAQGYKLVVTQILTDGIYNVDPQDTASFTRDIFMVGSTKRKTDKLDLKGSWDYLDLDNQLVAKPVVIESTCGQTSGMLAVSYSSLIKKSSTEATDSYIGVYRSELQLQLVRCQ